MATQIINPFIVAGKIAPEYFCDRREESRRLVREVTNGNNLVLISPRRMGKTGLIKFCFDKPEIKRRYETFYIDILQTTSLKEFTYLLGKEIFQRLVPHGQRRLKQFVAILRSIGGSFGFDPFSGSPTFNLRLGDISDPQLTIEEIFQYLENSGVRSIIAIDEFQQISNYKEKNVEAFLRSHIQQLSATNFIFAGSERHLLQQMFLSDAGPFYNCASTMELKPIEPPEYISFADTLFAEYGKKLDENGVKSVYDLLDGNTFYIQKTLNLAFSKTEKGGVCTIPTLKESIFETLTSYDTIYREILSQTAEPQKQLLIAIAREGNATGITSAKFIHDHALTSASSVQAASKKLLDSNFLIRNGNTYKLQDPLLRLWLLDTYTSEYHLM